MNKGWNFSTEDEISQHVINFLESGCILWSMDELSGKWMKTAVSSEVDEINSMSEWPDGMAQRSDQGGPWYPVKE
jgi:hypothetical protein